ncbi:hypothetical protein ACQ4M3_07305 [Leptolyngbya sp. AN03gr2]|uniref:hypothetical protein n=1 Tax=unclassified Leptolyngbya TaxID=2650499 RepID=UPI003D30F343
MGSPHDQQPKALFLSPDNRVYPDSLICSGIIPGELEGNPCPYSEEGQFPELVILDDNDPTYTIDKGNPGDLCPSCVKQNLSHLGHWQGHHNQDFPEELLPLRLFKCRMWFWLVVPGLYDAQPQVLVSM